MSDVWIVDDQLTGRMVLERLASLPEAPATTRMFTSPADALAAAHASVPDLVLVDYQMPQMDGVAFTHAFRSLPGCGETPVVVVTSFEDRDLRCRSLEAGATDFLTKPVDPNEFLARCRNLLTLRSQQKLIRGRAEWLEQQVAEATREIQLRERDTLLHLARAGEYRDEETGNHVVRMSRYSRLIAETLGIPAERCALLELSAPMHDIGKIGISDTILLKEGRLAPQEFEALKAHTTIGYEILKGSPSKYLQTGAIIALGHHERFDGSGYPGGLSGEEIPLFSRIVAVADVYDALTSERPYKRAWPAAEAVACIREESGKHFDPACVDAFLACYDRIRAVQDELPDPAERKRSCRDLRACAS